MNQRPNTTSEPVPGAPATLRVAAVVIGIEGLLTSAYGVGELLHVSSGRVVMGVTTAGFFAAYGAGLVLCGWGLSRVRSLARGPALFAQLIWLGLAWNFRVGQTWPIAALLAVLAGVSLVLLIHPRSIEALNR